jgi:hypothetical protein
MKLKIAVVFGLHCVIRCYRCVSATYSLASTLMPQCGKVLYTPLQRHL